MGVDKRIIAHGEGPPITSHQIVTVHCTAFGKNNDFSKQFWSTKDCQRLICPIPLSFEVGRGHVIKGWDEGVYGMRLGEVARLTCTPDYAFGARGCQAWEIESNSILEFEIEVLAIDSNVMPEDLPITAPSAATTNRERTLGFPFSNFGRVLREVYKRKNAGFKVKRVTIKSTLKNHHPKLKRKMKHSSSGADEMDGGMSSHQPMLSSARVESGAVAYQKLVDWDFLLSIYERQNSTYSKMALQYYNKEQPDQFELVRALHAQKLRLNPPGTTIGVIWKNGAISSLLVDQKRIIECKNISLLN